MLNLSPRFLLPLLPLLAGGGWGVVIKNTTPTSFDHYPLGNRSRHCPSSCVHAVVTPSCEEGGHSFGISR